jgi:glutamyl-tRNA synthetase
MHLGNAFTALLAYLSVRAQNGTLLLRIEDLDPARCKPEYAQILRDDLHWLGLDWDAEMPPQSQRSALYEAQFARLWKTGQVYPCFCSRDALHDASAPHAADGTRPYNGHCRSLTAEEIARQTRAPAWRLRVPPETVTFLDGLQGAYCEELEKDCGDFILRRSDGVYAYQLAVVTDDALGAVTEVVRGCDLLSSTPRQLYLGRLLGFPAPRYYHVPILTAPDGRRLSKRDADLSLGALRQRMTPQAVIGALAFAAGLLPQNTPVSARELVQEFSWQKVPPRRTLCAADFFH